MVTVWLAYVTMCVCDTYSYIVFVTMMIDSLIVNTENIQYTHACVGVRIYNILGLWLRLECSLDSLSIDSAHVIYVSEGYDVAYNRRTASQPSYVVLRVTWYVKTFRNVNYVC